MEKINQERQEVVEVSLRGLPPGVVALVVGYQAPEPVEWLLLMEHELIVRRRKKEELKDFRLIGKDRRRTDILTRRLSDIYCRLFGVRAPIRFLQPRKARDRVACVGGCGQLLYPTKNSYSHVYCDSECGGRKWHKLGSEYVHGVKSMTEIVYPVQLRLPPFVELDRQWEYYKPLMEISARIRALTA